MTVYQIKNQTIREGGFMRSLVLDAETNQPRPVWRADRSNGRSRQAGTYQHVKPGDIVIKVDIDSSTKESKLTFKYVDDSGIEVPVSEDFNFKPTMSAINTLVEEWLYSSKSEPFLPKGVGWDGTTPHVEKIKVDKAMALLPDGMPPALLTRLMNAINYTSINVFNNCTTTMLSKKSTLTIPACDICIEIDINGNYVDIQELSDSRSGDYSPLICIHDDTCKLAIICFNAINSTSVKQLTLTIIELV